MYILILYIYTHTPYMYMSYICCILYIYITYIYTHVMNFIYKYICNIQANNTINNKP